MAENSGCRKASNEETILDFIKQNFFLLDRKDLAKIDTQLFCSILSRFLEDFGVENYSQTDLVAIQGVSNIECYEETTQLFNLWQAVHNLVAPTGLTDFTLDDLLQPRKQRALKVISHLIYLWNKFTSVYSDWQYAEDDIADLPEKISKIQEENMSFRKIVETKSCQLSKMRSDNSAQGVELSDCCELQEKLKATGEELKEESRISKLEIVKKKEAFSEFSLKITQLRQDIEVLRCKVVRSPEKIVAEIENQEKQLDNLRNEKLNLDKEYTNTYKNFQDLAVAAVKDAETTKDSLSLILATMEDRKSEINKDEEINDAKAMNERTIAELDAVIQQNKKTFDEILKQKSLSGIQHSQRVQPTRKMNDDWKTKFIEVSKEESELKNGFQKDEKNLLHQHLEVEEKHDDFIHELQNNKQLVTERVSNFLNDVKGFRI